ncbi:hypothetical protein [Desertivirga arenae]|uniref:hypothetical protein n=1 Tax=Desertivirga arenae TaxID=2810309 RepID=UPI001A97C1EE|nr:hypothetical protein [Pedobacter sp. SYSU D00823]
MKKIDLYSGFESDPNIVFRQRKISNEIIEELELWYGYFYTIVELIPMVENPHPDSLLFHWYNRSGFFNHTKWECKRIRELYEQVLSVQDKVPAMEAEAYDALKQILLSTMRNNSRLFIAYGC